MRRLIAITKAFCNDIEDFVIETFELVHKRNMVPSGVCNQSKEEAIAFSQPLDSIRRDELGATHSCHEMAIHQLWI